MNSRGIEPQMWETCRIMSQCILMWKVLLARWGVGCLLRNFFFLPWEFYFVRLPAAGMLLLLKALTGDPCILSVSSSSTGSWSQSVIWGFFIKRTVVLRSRKRQGVVWFSDSGCFWSRYNMYLNPLLFPTVNFQSVATWCVNDWSVDFVLMGLWATGWTAIVPVLRDVSLEVASFVTHLPWIKQVTCHLVRVYNGPECCSL